jgi:hypothetical protein
VFDKKKCENVVVSKHCNQTEEFTANLIQEEKERGERGGTHISPSQKAKIT